jgi:hypothetical protein
MSTITITRTQLMGVLADSTPRGIAKAIMEALPTVTSIDMTEGPGTISYRCKPPLDPPQRAMAQHVVSTRRPPGQAIDVL